MKRHTKIPKSHEKIEAGIIFIGFVIVYVLTQTHSIYGGDAGDLVSAAYTHGVPHPPGYPLYTMIGYILSHLVTVNSIAWRVGLVSSIPAAASLSLLFVFLKRITGSLLISLISISYLGANYIFWLYAIVPEVFSLHILFVVCQLLVIYTWTMTKNKKYLYIFLFLFALSLSHHHVILFLLPAYLYMLYINRKSIQVTKKTLLTGFLICVAGLLPYAYAYIAAHSQPPINWDNPTTIGRLFDLVSRSYYGTFTSSVTAEISWESRIRAIGLYGIYIVEDFSFLSLAIMGMGGRYLYRAKKVLFNFIVLAIVFSGPLFLFYAAFSVRDSIEFATVERFLLTSYVYLTVLFALGIWRISSLVTHYLFTKTSAIRNKTFMTNGIIVAFLILPVSSIISNYPKISPLTYDQTAEHFARDMLVSMESGSVFLPTGDTSLFNTQYIQYTTGEFRNISIVHKEKIERPEIYRDYYTKQFDNKLFFPEQQDYSEEEYIDEFIQKNKNVYSDIYLPISTGTWVPYGLTLRYYPEDSLPDIDVVVEKNEQLWGSFHDPLSGSLGKYRNLLLSDVITYYEYGHVKTADYYMKNKRNEESLPHLSQAIALNPENPHNYFLRSVNQFALISCDEAERDMRQAIALNDSPLSAIEYQAFVETIYRDCFKDDEKAKKEEEKLEMLKRELETPLSEL